MQECMSFSKICLVLLTIFVTVLFINSPGTTDIDDWIKWANNADQYGLILGFKANEDNYPPFAPAIVHYAVELSRLFGIGTFGAIKLSITFFLFLSSAIFWLWSRDSLYAFAFHLSVLLNSIALGYIDIYFAPSLIASMWALRAGRLTPFAILFSIACLTKWQPLIIGPFIGAYIINVKQISKWDEINVNVLWRVLAPSLGIIIITFYIFGTAEVFDALRRAHHKMLSGNALNFNWILTHVLHVLNPTKYGELHEGEAAYLTTVSYPLSISVISSGLFALFYISTFISFFKREKTFENLVVYSMIGFLAYFTFNIGVHENHLFIAAVLSIMLVMITKKHAVIAIIIISMSNINLIVFYGFDGTALKFSRVMGGIIDMALVLSVFNVICFLLLWYMKVIRATPAAGNLRVAAGRSTIQHTSSPASRPSSLSRKSFALWFELSGTHH